MNETRKELNRVFWVLTGFKVGYLLTVLAAVLLWSDPNLGEIARLPQRWPRHGKPTFANHFAPWDAGYYLSLSEAGYTEGDAACAFYPLWPWLMRWFAPVTGGNHLMAGLLLSNVCSLAAWVLFRRLVARRWGTTAANWSLVFLAVFPGSLFFQFNYTESLFLLLVLVLWWALEERRYGWAWLAAGLLPLTRGVGVFAVLPIAWHALQPARPWLRLWWRERDCAALLGLPGHEVAGRAWLLAAPLLGWGIYLALMGYWTGHPFEGFEAQKYWGVHSIGNLWNVPKFIVGLFTPTEWHAFTGSVLDRCAFLLLLDCLPLLWRLDKGLLVWTYMLGILPAMSGTFTSFTRFASCAFPMFIALGVFLSRREWRWPRYGLLSIFVVLHIVLVWRYANCRWAG